MAKTADEETVVLEEEGAVTVDVSDNPELAEAGKDKETPKSLVEAGAETTTEPPKKEKIPRVAVKQPKAVVQPAADQAALELTPALKKAEEARKAAEQTAQAERLQREAAERRAQQSEQVAKTAQEQVQSHELVIINSGIESAKRELEAHELEMQRALEAGEFNKVTAAQVKLSKAAAALDRLEDAKAAYESGARKQPTTEGRVEAPQQTISPFEQYVQGFAPQSQAWLRTHPECVPPNVGGNATSNAKMMAGHYDAIAKGFQPNSDDYFRVIEEHTGHREPVVATEEAESEPLTAVKPIVKPRAQVSAPPSREPPTATGLSRATRSVTLSKEQQEAAKISFPHLQPQQAFSQYARNLLELESEGKLGRTTH